MRRRRWRRRSPGPGAGPAAAGPPASPDPAQGGATWERMQAQGAWLPGLRHPVAEPSMPSWAAAASLRGAPAPAASRLRVQRLGVQPVGLPGLKQGPQAPSPVHNVCVAGVLDVPARQGSRAAHTSPNSTANSWEGAVTLLNTAAAEGPLTHRAHCWQRRLAAASQTFRGKVSSAPHSLPQTCMQQERKGGVV